MFRYDAKAAADIERTYLTPEITRQRLQTIEALAPSRGEQILDAGCGTGLLTELLAAAVGSDGRVTGLDASQDMLDLAASRCQSLDNIDLCRGSVTQLEFESSYFDAACCIQTLLYIAPVETALAELHRVLKPRGRLAVIETDWRGVVMRSLDDALTRRIFNAWDGAVHQPHLPVRLIPLLRQAGFAAIRVQAIPLLSTSYSETGFSAHLLRSMAANAVKHRQIDQSSAERWQAQILELACNHDFFFCANRFLFTAVK